MFIDESYLFCIAYLTGGVQVIKDGAPTFMGDGEKRYCNLRKCRERQRSSERPKRAYIPSF